MQAGFETFVEVLRARAEERPDARVVTWLSHGEQSEEHLTYAELDRRARAVAAELQRRNLRGRRVLLLYVPGLDFPVAFFGCLYAGAVPVPAYPPEPARLARTLPRLLAIVQSCEPALVLTTSSLLQLAPALFAQAPDLAKLPWAASDTCLDPRGWSWPSVGPDDVAFVQYTSGSTADAKGVVVTHANVLANVAMMQEAGRQDERTNILLWLPFYHDLGLIGGVLMPPFLGSSSVLMSPIDFLHRPARWLRAMSRHRAAVSAAPTFALDLCLRRVRAEELDGVDLSSWDMALIGAEPLRAQTLRAFTERFAPYGLRPEAIYQGYGLAEAVLSAVSGSVDEVWRSVRLDPDSLAAHRAVLDPDGVEVVSCGQPLPRQGLAIVDPVTRRERAQGEVGEVWLAGPNVAQGYLGLAEESERTFVATLADGEGHSSGTRAQDPAQLAVPCSGAEVPRVAVNWLRTGDLGFLHEGELYVTGRLKELIIVRGRNHYPQDLERTVEACHASVRPGASCAVAPAGADGEELVVLAEVERESDHGAVVGAIRGALAEAHGLTPRQVVLLAPRTIVKTSSGKLARSATLASWQRGELDVVHLGEAALARTPSLLAAVAALVAPTLGVRAEALEVDRPVIELGLDSLAALEVAHRIEAELGVPVSPVHLLDGATLRQLVEGSGSKAGRPRHRLLALQPLRVRRPLFCVGGAPGTALYLRELARALGPEQPVYAFRTPGLDGSEAPLTSVDDLAARYVAEMQELQPEGPWAIAGHSFGGLVAWEMARQITAAGGRVGALLLLDTTAAHGEGGTSEEVARWELKHVLARTAAPEVGLDALVQVYRANFAAMVAYRPGSYDGPVTLLRARGGFPSEAVMHPSRGVCFAFDRPDLGWADRCAQLTVVEVPGDHFDMVGGEHAAALAAAIGAALAGSGTMEIEAIGQASPPPRFDPFDPAVLADPYPAYERLRRDDPVHWSGLSVWIVSRHAEVAAALRDPRFSSDGRAWQGREGRALDTSKAQVVPSALTAWFRAEEQTPMGRLYNHMMSLLDPPRHTRLRALVTKAFTPAVVERMRPGVRASVGQLLDAAQEQSQVDLVRDLALPLPVQVIASILGIPQEDTDLLRQWSHDLVQSFDPLVSREVFERAEAVVPALTDYIVDRVRERRRAPTDDLLGRLTLAEVEGDRLTQDELVANVVLLFIAGFETTTNMIGNGLLALLRNPDQLQLLRDRPELVADAVEELLRYDGPFRSVFRTITEDVELGGRRLRAGDYALLLLGSANRDPAAIEHADRLDLRRRPARHLAFGGGRHYCLGAALARVELQEAIGVTVQRFPDFSLLPGGLEWRRSASLRGPSRFLVDLGKSG